MSNRKLKSLVVSGLFLLICPHLAADQRPRWHPAGGFVPDETTAARVAEAVLELIYGAKLIQSEKPLRAVLNNGVWIVTGTLPKGLDGGAAEVRISKSTCEILFVTHEQ